MGFREKIMPHNENHLRKEPKCSSRLSFSLSSSYS